MENKNNENDSPKIENHMENCNVFMGDSYGGVFPLPGAQVTVNQFLDSKKMKNGTGQQVEGRAESKEEREKRKAEVVKAITGKFDFADNQLGYDSQHKRITNDRLASLFRKCLGMGYIPPTAENRAIQEQLWVLLMDERNQCFKTEGEGFFRQTVLNIIGYFAHCGLVMGSPLDLARAVFKDADSNLAKNVFRNITSNVFPDGLVDMMDHYIDKLQDGEF